MSNPLERSQTGDASHSGQNLNPLVAVHLERSPIAMKPKTGKPQTGGCTACGLVEPRSAITDNMARFTNTDDRTDACLRRIGMEVPLGTEVWLCRKHAVLLERELTIEYLSATPYVRPLPHIVPSVGVDTRPQRAQLTTWLGDSFLPLATLGPQFRLFGKHIARRVTVEFEGLTLTGVWLCERQDFVRLRTA